MRKFKVKVERIDEYEIGLDENIINEEFMEHYKEYFSDIDTLEEHAENIAIFRARFGERFIEDILMSNIGGSKNGRYNR